MKLNEFLLFNPQERLPKGTLAIKISMANLGVNTRRPQCFSIEQYNGGAKFRKGDTIFARLTSCLENGKTAYVDVLSDSEIAFGSTEYIVMRAKPNISLPLFVYYLAISKIIRDPATKSVVGSTRQRVQQAALEELEIPDFSLVQQRHIVDILGSLDDKIENNERIVGQMETFIHLEYKKMMMQNKTFTFEKIGDFVQCTLGGTPSRKKAEYWNGDIPWINSGKVNEFRIIEPSEYITNLGLQKSNTTLIPKNSTVLAITGATLGQVSILGITCCTNQSVIAILENEKLPTTFIYPMICDRMNDIINLQTGGAQQHINKGNIEHFIFEKPTGYILKQYHEFITPIFNKIIELCNENRLLTRIKSSYLKKFFG